MTWSRTFTGIVAISADIFTASVCWKEADVTVSSLCGLELRKPGGIWSLRTIGEALNGIQHNHCELAIASDIARCRRALKLLGGWPDMRELTDQYLDTLPDSRRSRAQWELISFCVYLQEQHSL